MTRRRRKGLRAEVRAEQRVVFEESRREPVHFTPGRLREIEGRDLAIRFAFGFVIAVAVGVLTKIAGDRIAGLFLAFPAILPASLTLIGEKRGRRKALLDAAGSVFGAVGLIAFAVVSWLLLGRVPAVAAQLGALVAWGAVALTCYGAVRMRSASSESDAVRS